MSVNLLVIGFSLKVLLRTAQLQPTYILAMTSVNFIERYEE